MPTLALRLLGALLGIGAAVVLAGVALTLYIAGERGKALAVVVVLAVAVGFVWLGRG